MALPICTREAQADRTGYFEAAWPYRRITCGCLRILSGEGAVAAAAGVPLGSTTYHFATLDDLLAVALRTAAEDNIERLREWEQNLPRDADLAAVLTDLLMRGLTEERSQTVVGYELYVAALHRPQLRSASTAWDEALAEQFAFRTDLVTGRLLAAIFRQAIPGRSPKRRVAAADVEN